LIDVICALVQRRGPGMHPDIQGVMALREGRPLFKTDGCERMQGRANLIDLLSPALAEIL
jgi:hypothetical protein